MVTVKNDLLIKRNLMKLFFLLFSFSIFTVEAMDQLNAQQVSLEHWIEKAKNNIHKKILSNGLTILFYPVTHTREVDLRVTVGVGSRDEPQGYYGLAHMVEHMIFKGTHTKPETYIKRTAEKCGRTAWNAFTSMDQTSYFFRTDDKNWPIFLDILADCMKNARFDEDHFASEVKAVISELNLNRSRPSRKMIESAVLSVFPLNHPYHHSPIGTREDLIASTGDMLKEFYHQHYTPERTLITIVGNIDESSLFQVLEEKFSTPEANRMPECQPYHPEAFLSTDFVQVNTVIHTQTTNPSAMLYWTVPGTRSNQTLALECIEYILQERLTKLKDVADLVFSCNVFGMQFLDAGLFCISYEPKTEDHSKKLSPTLRDQHVNLLIEHEIDDLKHHGPKTEELAKYKTLVQNQFAYGFENIDFIVGILSTYALNNSELEAFDRYKISQSLNKNDIRNFCHQYLTKNTQHIIKCVPLNEKEKSLWMHRQNEIDSYERALLKLKERATPIDEEVPMHELPEPQILELTFQKPTHQATLSNGLSVYLTPRTHSPHVSLKIGLKKEDQLSLAYAQSNQMFIPYFSMNMLIEGSEGTEKHTEEFSKKEHWDFFDRLGALSSINTEGVTIECLPEDLGIIIEYISHILAHPTFPEDVFERMRYNMIQKIYHNAEDAGHCARQALTRHLYKDCPWIKDDQAIIKELKHYSRNQLIEFHKQNVNPGAMFVVITGNVNPIETISILERSTMQWATPDPSNIQETKLDSFKQPENPEHQHMLIHHPKEQIIIIGGRLTTTKDSDDALALILIEGYLNRTLFDIREQTGVFYGCSASLAPNSFLVKSIGSIATQTSQEHAEYTQEAITHVLENIAKHGIPAEYIDNAKQNYAMTIAKAYSSNQDLAHAHATILSRQQSFDYFEHRSSRIKELSIEKINAVAHEYCNPSTWTFIKAGRVNNHVIP